MMTFRKIAAVAALLLVAGIARAAPPKTITYSGFLLDSAGAPVGGSSLITFRLYDAEAAGNRVYLEAITVLPSPSDGYFSATIGLAQLLPDVLFANPLWLSVQYGAEAEMAPRIALSSVPSSFSAVTVDWTGIQNRPSSSCSGATPYVTGIGANGAVTCGAAPGSGASSCATGEILKWSGTAWACAADADTNTTYSAAPGGPLTLTGTVFSIGAATTATAGYLSAADWNTFNGKLASVSISGPLTGSGTAGSPLGVALANGTTDGYLSSADWSTFSGKLGTVSRNAPLTGAGTTASPLSLPAANSGTDGYLSGVDWQAFNAKLGAVAAAWPFTGTGTGGNPLSLPMASYVDAGYLSSVAFAFFSGKLDAATTAWPLSGDGAGGGALTLSPCTPGVAGEVMTWNGTAWTCASVITSVNPLVGGGINVYAGAGGYREIALADTGVMPGTYTAVQVDSQGRVVAGGNYSSLAGYGITDGVELQPTPAGHLQTGDIAVLGDIYATTFVGNLSGAASSVAGNSIQPSSLYMAGAPAPSPGQVPASGVANDFYWITPVTQVTAGSGLTGGGSGTPSLAANFTVSGGTNGVGATVARGDHTHTPTTRVISVPAESIAIAPGGTIITRSLNGLIWQNNAAADARIYIRKPLDFVPTGNVTFRIMFRTGLTTAAAGTVSFFVRAASFNSGSAYSDASSTQGTAVNVAATTAGSFGVVYEQVFTLASTRFANNWWMFKMQNNDGTATYTGDLEVMSVSIEYAANL